MTRVLPKGWEEKTLGEVCSFNRGLTYKKSDEVSLSSNVVLRANNIDLSTNSLNFDELKYLSPNFEIPADKKVQKDCLLICTASGSKSHLGKVALIDKDYGYAFGGFMGLLLPDKFIDSHYLFYALTSKPYFDFVSHLTDGANINNLKWSQLQDFKLIIPSLPEQKRIVEKLDKIFADIDKAKENTQKNLANAKELFKNSLDMLLEQDKERYPITSLGRVATLIPGIAFKSKEFGNFPQKAVKISNILPPKISNSLDGVDIGAYNKEKISKYLLRKGDICVAMTGGTIGKLGMYDMERETYVNQRVLLIRSTSEINCKFLHYILMHPKFLLFIKSNIESDTAQPNISADTIGKYKFFLPTIDKQRVLLKRLTESENKTQELEQIYTKKLVNLEELKQSVLQQAFSGKL